MTNPEPRDDDGTRDSIARLVAADHSARSAADAAKAPHASERDPLGAIVPHGFLDIAGASAGPLSGLNFAVKDSFDVEGVPTGYGSPEWLSTHSPAVSTSPAVTRILEAGANLVAKTRMDELGYSLSGLNIHYGMPLNPAAPRRTPGGSSSGSAALVAGAVVPFALAADGGGSVRTPASYCGILGMRASHGRIVDPGMGSTAAIGWFAADVALLHTVGSLLLEDFREATEPTAVYLADDLFAAAEPGVREASAAGIARIEAVAGTASSIDLADGALREWRETFREVQAAENWSAWGQWLEERRPALGPDIADRFARAQMQPEAVTAQARERRVGIRRRLDDVLGAGAVVIAPSAAGAAPLRTASYEHLEHRRARAFQIMCPTGLGGLAQVSLPLAEYDDAPLGVSLIAAPGRDEMLLDLASKIMSAHP